MDTEPKKPLLDFSQAGLPAWGNALVKTGTEHLDLSMVRQGKKALNEAETMAQDGKPKA